MTRTQTRPREQSWAKHRQAWYGEMLRHNPEVPLWLRASWAAFERHKINGHACFGVGELARLLGAEPTQVSRAIRTAAQKGALAPTSKARCLVVPSHAISGGNGGRGRADEVCPVHGKVGTQ